MARVVAVDKIGVRVYPKTDRFLRELKRDLRRFERRKDVRMVVPVYADLNKASFERVEKRLKALRATAQVDLELADGAVKKFKARMKEATKDQTVDLDLNLKHYRHVKHQLKRLTKKRDVTIDADLDRGVARAKLAWLTRPRIVKIIPVVSKRAAADVSKALARLTGMRVGKDYLKDLWDWFKNIDKHAPKIAAVTTILLGLTSVLTHATAATVTFFGQLSAVGGLVMILPGMLASAAFGVTTLVLAMKDADKYVGDLKDDFRRLRDTISGGFWASAEKPIRETVERLLPRLESRMGDTAKLMGANFAAIATQLEETLSPKVVDELFDHLDQSLRELQPGLMDFTHALTVIGVKGSKYLVRLNKWISELGSRFSKWIEDAVADGRFDQWFEKGIQASKDFGRFLNGLGRTLKGFYKASKEAGHAGLSTAADGMQRLADALNSARVQSKLVPFLRSARRAADDLWGGLGRILRALGNIHLTLGRVMESAGRTLGDLMAGIADMIRNPAFTRGLERMFKGFEKGFGPLAEHSESFAKVLGSLGRVIGIIAELVGPMIGIIADALGPLLDKFADLYESAEPYIQALIDKLGELAETGVGWVLGKLAEFEQWWSVNGPAIQQQVQGIVDRVRELGESVVAKLTFDFGLGDYDFSDMLEPLAHLWETVQEYLAPVVDAVREVFTHVYDSIVEIWGDVQAWWDEHGAMFVESITRILEFLQPLWDTAWTMLSGTVKTVWDVIVGIVSGAWNIIVGIFEVFGGILSGDWEMLWAGVERIFDGFKIWFTTIVQTLWNTAVTTFESMWTLIKGYFQYGVQVVKERFNEMWTGLKSAAVEGVEKVVSTVSDIKDRIVSFFSNAGTWLYESGSKVVQGFIDGLNSVAERVTTAAKNIAGKARDFFPFSPAKRGPFSGRGWVLYSGQSVGKAFAKGIAASSIQVEREALNLTARARRGLDGLDFGGRNESLISRLASGSVDLRTQPMEVDISGSQLSGMLQLPDGSFARLVDGRIESAMRGQARRLGGVR